MLPIQKLLNRIRWDPRFRAGRFGIGYYDRRVNGILMVPLEAIRFPDDMRFVFELYDEEGEVYRIPFHRVRRVTRNGRVIWRSAPARERPQDAGLDRDSPF
jgi:uncharacterized protein (UPF0248 family)